jgi:seryl-tRNA synthetase
MLDVSVIRDDPGRIREMLKNRNYPEELINQFLEIDNEWRRLVDESNQLKRKRNEASHQIPKLKGDEKSKLVSEMKEVATSIYNIDAKVAELETSRNDVVLLIPNIPDDTVPFGGSYDNNCCIRTIGKERSFDFIPKDHIQIGEDLDIIDFDRGTKIAGSGFYVLKGDGARLERALINYMLDRSPRWRTTCTGARGMTYGSTLRPRSRSLTCTRTRSWRRTSCLSTTPHTCHRSDERRAGTLR